MKLLFLAHRIPYPPDKGDKIRSYQVLKYLASRHEVFLACLIDNERDWRAIAELRRWLPNLLYERLRRWQQRLFMLRALATGQPLTVLNFYSPAFRRQLVALAQKEKFDALFVYSSNMADYGRDLPIPVRVIDFCDLDSEKFKQFARQSRPPFSWLYRLEGERLAAFEKQAAEYFDHIIFIGPEEKKLFDVNGRSHKVALMSNGVDFAQYYGNKLPASTVLSPGHKPYVLFTGAMDYLPNIDAAHWFARAIFPPLRATLPELQFYIVGGNPAGKIRQLHDERAGIIVTGYVDDIRPYVKNASVFVAPLRIARGMQTKILEAMACGVPVVTSLAAARGIGAQPEQEVLVAETAADYAGHVQHLLANVDSREQLRRQAFDFLQVKFKWEKNLQLLDDLLQQKN